MSSGQRQAARKASRKALFGLMEASLFGAPAAPRLAGPLVDVRCGLLVLGAAGCVVLLACTRKSKRPGMAGSK